MLLLVLMAYAIVMAFSWLVTCGIVKLICLCFGLTFTWLIGTGVWLVIFLAKIAFNNK